MKPQQVTAAKILPLDNNCSGFSVAVRSTGFAVEQALEDADRAPVWLPVPAATEGVVSLTAAARLLRFTGAGAATVLQQSLADLGVTPNGELTLAQQVAAIIAAAASPKAWYDPSDLRTLFQDYLGTIPVTAAGQPVGLMLDKSQGLVRGPEKNTTPAFPSAVSVNDAIATSQTPLIAGRFYEVMYTIAPESTWTGVAWLPDLGVFGGDASQGPGTFKYIIRAPGTGTSGVAAGGGPSNTGELIVSAYSVRELPGNHAYQPTTTARPTYQVRAGHPCIVGDGIDDYLMTSVSLSGDAHTLLIGRESTGPASWAARLSVSNGALPMPDCRLAQIGMHPGELYHSRFDSDTVQNISFPRSDATFGLGVKTVFGLYLMQEGPNAVQGQTSVNAEFFNPSATSGTCVFGNVQLGVLAAYQDGSGAAADAVYGAIYINDEVSANERQTLIAYLAQQSGAAL